MGLPFGKQVKVARILRGFTHESLGSAIGKNRTTVHTIEHGLHPTDEVRERLIEVLGMDETFVRGCDLIAESAVMADGEG